MFPLEEDPLQLNADIPPLLIKAQKWKAHFYAEQTGHLVKFWIRTDRRVQQQPGPPLTYVDVSRETCSAAETEQQQRQRRQHRAHREAPHVSSPAEQQIKKQPDPSTPQAGRARAHPPAALSAQLWPPLVCPRIKHPPSTASRTSPPPLSASPPSSSERLLSSDALSASALQT